MENPGDSPQATRQRVFVFGFMAFVVILVVALWPLKGYRIDRRPFALSLDSPYLAIPPEEGGLGRLNPDLGGKPAYFSVLSSETSLQSRKGHEMLRPIMRLPASAWQNPGLPPNVYAAEVGFAGDFGLCFQSHNVWGNVAIEDRNLPEGMTKEQVANEALKAFLDGIDREIPGVTTFYNPPARQLWIDRVRPVLEKHFPKKPGP